MEYLIAHTKGNPRNSEGAFVKLKDGSIMFCYTRYIGEDWHDHCSAEIVAIVSADGGKSWSAPRTIVPFQGVNVMSVSLLRLQDSRIALHYLRKLSIPDYPDYLECRPTMLYSSDEGVNWSAPQDVAQTPSVYMICNNDRLIQLANGRLLLPVANHIYTKGFYLGPSVTRFMISDDNGSTWRNTADCLYPENYMHLGLMEPGVIELADHRLMCWMRTRAGCQYKSFSSDNGEHWSKPIPAFEFLSHDSPLSMKRNPVNGKLYAIWNDYNPTRSVRFEPGVMGRTPLMMAVSSDEGATWSEHNALEDSPRHGFAYTAMLFDENKLFLAYCCGGLDSCACMLQNLKIKVIEL